MGDTGKRSSAARDKGGGREGKKEKGMWMTGRGGEETGVNG